MPIPCHEKSICGLGQSRWYKTKKQKQDRQYYSDWSYGHEFSPGGGLITFFPNKISDFIVIEKKNFTITWQVLKKSLS
jgi:hypothetical protein